MVIGFNGDPIGAFFDRPSDMQPHQVYSFSNGLHINTLVLNLGSCQAQCRTSASAFPGALQGDGFPVLGRRTVSNTDHLIEGRFVHEVSTFRAHAS